MGAWLWGLFSRRVRGSSTRPTPVGRQRNLSQPYKFPNPLLEFWTIACRELDHALKAAALLLAGVFSQGVESNFTHNRGDESSREEDGNMKTLHTGGRPPVVDRRGEIAGADPMLTTLPRYPTNATGWNPEHS
jgi:hypothetical protein